MPMTLRELQDAIDQYPGYLTLMVRMPGTLELRDVEGIELTRIVETNAAGTETREGGREAAIIIDVEP